MTTLEKIVKAAKALKKKYPNKYSKWTDYVKAASKTVKPVKKVGAVKKKATSKKKVAPKKAAPKKKAAPRSSHKDTKSHNVNIRVVSGLSKSSQFHIDMMSRILKQIERHQMTINDVKEQLKTPFGKANRSYLLNKQKEAKKGIVSLKKSLSIHKQAIK